MRNLWQKTQTNTEGPSQSIKVSPLIFWKKKKITKHTINNKKHHHHHHQKKNKTYKTKQTSKHTHRKKLPAVLLTLFNAINLVTLGRSLSIPRLDCLSSLIPLIAISNITHKQWMHFKTNTQNYDLFLLNNMKFYIQQTMRTDLNIFMHIKKNKQTLNFKQICTGKSEQSQKWNTLDFSKCTTTDVSNEKLKHNILNQLKFCQEMILTCSM